METSIEPKDLISYLIIIIGWIFTFWRGYVLLIGKVNAVGEKYNELVLKVTANETRIDAVKEELAQERLAVMTMMFNNEKAANERHAELKIEITKLTERLNIRSMVHEVFTEIKENAG